jgi:hypothetical protein
MYRWQRLGDERRKRDVHVHSANGAELARDGLLPVETDRVGAEPGERNVKSPGQPLDF